MLPPRSDRDEPLGLDTNSVFSSSGKKLEVETINVLNDLQVLIAYRVSYVEVSWGQECATALSLLAFLTSGCSEAEDGVKYITVDNPKFAVQMQWYLFSESHGKLASLRAQLLLLLPGSPGWAALGGVLSHHVERPSVTE